MAEDLKLNANSKSFVYAKLSALIDSSGKSYRVTVKEWRERRSLSQNSLYWVWMQFLQDNLPVSDQKHDKEVWHEYLKKYFCPVKVIAMPAGQDAEVKSTKILDVGEFTYYMNKVEQWAQGHMLALPVPEDSEYAQLMRKQEN